MIPSITLPLKTLADLLFRAFDCQWGERCLSHAKGDSLFPIRVPKTLGKLLEDQDTDERKVFHIIHFPTHSEVWRMDWWMLSASRREEILQRSEARSAEYLAQKAIDDRTNSRYTVIRQYLCANHPIYANRNMAGVLHNLCFVLARAEDSTISQLPGLPELLVDLPLLTDKPV